MNEFHEEMEKEYNYKKISFLDSANLYGDGRELLFTDTGFKLILKKIVKKIYIKIVGNYVKPLCLKQTRCNKKNLELIDFLYENIKNQNKRIEEIESIIKGQE